jgi:acetyl-CoA C-acetyltransferase
VLHSIAAMVEVLRADPDSLGLVSGVGMHMTKHVYGLYSTAPPSTGCATPPDGAGVQARLQSEHPTTPIVATWEGPATVTTYTVAHGKGGGAEWGLVLADVPDGSGRAYGRVEDPDVLPALEAEEWVGRTVQLSPVERPNGVVNLVSVG